MSKPMSGTLTLVDLAGAVALLLWGVHMVRSGVQRAFGSEFRRILSRGFGGRLQAFATGLGVAAVLQSSTATALIVTSFASCGFVALVPALAAMLGANVGTTLIVQVLSFDVSALSPLLLLVGVAAFRSRSTRTRDLGRVAIGLGLMLIALSRLLDVVAHYEDVPSLRMVMGRIATDPVISALFGAAMAWAAHSSVAVALLVMSLTGKGVLSLNAAIALMIGANIGTAINPLLEGSRSADVAGRRVAVGNLATRLTGAMVVMPLIPWIGRMLVQIEPHLPRAVADFHTGFNIAIALAFLPLLTPVARLLERILPDRVEASDPSRPLYLDAAAIGSPSIALGYAGREALRMVDVLDSMIEAAADAFRRPDRKEIARSRRLDDVLDALNGEIKHYVIQLDPDGLSDEEHRRLEEILTFSRNLESGGDVIERNILPFAVKQMKRGVELSGEAEREIEATFQAARSNLGAAASIFMTGDLRAARALVEQKKEFRRREADAIRAHLAQLRTSNSRQALPLDLLRDIKRLNDHLVAGAAYPVLEASGALLPSRILDGSPEDFVSRRARERMTFPG
jgi:phosphate:Na+ symporter